MTRKARRNLAFQLACSQKKYGVLDDMHKRRYNVTVNAMQPMLQAVEENDLEMYKWLFNHGGVGQTRDSATNNAVFIRAAQLFRVDIDEYNAKHFLPVQQGAMIARAALVFPFGDVKRYVMRNIANDEYEEDALNKALPILLKYQLFDAF